MEEPKKKKKQAIDAKRLNAYAMPPEDIVIIGLDTEDGPEHHLWDSRIHLPLKEIMILNIMEYGVFGPIECQKDGDRVLVVAGRQRVKNAREANRRLRASGSATIEVPVMLLKGDPTRMFGVMVSENAHRTADEVLKAAQDCSRFLAYGKTDTDAAIAFGVSKGTIRNWMALLESPEAQEELKATGKVAKAYERARGGGDAGPKRSERVKTLLERILELDITDKKPLSRESFDLVMEIVNEAKDLLSTTRRRGEAK